MKRLGGTLHHEYAVRFFSGIDGPFVAWALPDELFVEPPQQEVE